MHDDQQPPVALTHTLTAPPFSMNGYRGWTRLVDCHDGDTVKLILPVANTLYVFPCRLLGINTPELRLEPDRAYGARTRLLQLCTQTVRADWSSAETREYLRAHPCLLWVECAAFEKYGRVLVKLWTAPDTSTESINDTLVREQWAVSYLV